MSEFLSSRNTRLYYKRSMRAQNRIFSRTRLELGQARKNAVASDKIKILIEYSREFKSHVTRYRNHASI